MPDTIPIDITEESSIAKNSIHFITILRALRLPFISASALPFIFGSFIEEGRFNTFTFIVGLLSAIATHLGANLINDYADSKSGTDWQDKKFYGFFGGSKLIQENILSEMFYLRSAIFCFFIALSGIIILSIVLSNLSFLVYYFIILILGIFYSCPPFKLSYRRLGEIIIFFLFGPALVMGGYFIQTGIFPELKSFLLSLPFGFLTTAILFANEIPDYPQDKKSGKNNWVGLLGEKKSWGLYLLLVSFAFLSIAFSILRGILSPWVGISLIFILPALKAANILKKNYSDKQKLIQSSRLTIAMHIGFSIILILGTII